MKHVPLLFPSPPSTYSCVLSKLLRQEITCLPNNKLVDRLNVINFFVFNFNSISTNNFKLFNKQFVFFSILSYFQSDLGALGQDFFNTNFKERQVSKVCLFLFLFCFLSLAISLGEKELGKC